VTVIVICACLALAGCGSDAGTPEPTATQVATVAATPTPPATPAAIGEIVWTAAVDPATNAPAGSLAALPDDSAQVVAALPVGSLPAGTVLTAHWTIDGDPLPSLDPPPVTVQQDRADAWVAWTLTWSGDETWPIGTLGIAIEVDGSEQRTGEIPIVRANG
jgi:hypothetical protein